MTSMQFRKLAASKPHHPVSPALPSEPLVACGLAAPGQDVA